MSLLAPVYNTLSRLYTAVYPRAVKLDNLDASITSRLSTTDARVDKLDAPVSSRVATTDARLDKLDATMSSRAAAADYTATRAGKIDNLDATVTSRLASADSRLNNLDASIQSRSTLTAAQVWSDASRITEAGIWSYAGRSVIRSVQHGTIQLNGLNIVAGMATITAVNLNKSFIVHSVSGPWVSDDQSRLRLSLSSDTTVQATRSSSGAGGEAGYASGIYSFHVVEFM